MERGIMTALLLAFAVVTSASTSAAGKHGDAVCELDDDSTNAVLDECLEKGDTFVRDYFRFLQRDKIGEFNACNEFKEFGSCIWDLWSRCQTIQQVTHKRWKPVVDLLSCSCNMTIEKHECHHERQCLETEFSGVLVKRCDELYDFNVNQGTRDKCVFLRNRIMCKTSLVETACGESVGRSAFAMSKINNKRTIEKSRCYISLDEPYHGFRYTNSCARDFKEEINICYDEHLLKHESSFKEKNDLIVAGKQSDLKDMCHNYREYKHCSRDARADCKQGVNLMYEQNGKLRSLLLKLEYICKEEKAAYQRNLQCMQHTLEEDSLSTCNKHWEDLEPWLDNITSYEYYCEAHNPKTKGMVKVLEELRHCFEMLFSLECNTQICSVMSELIRRAFNDPFYLRFAYKADCDLHRAVTSGGDRKTKRHPSGKYPHEPDEWYVRARSTLAPVRQYEQEPLLTAGVTSLRVTMHSYVILMCALLTVSFMGRLS